MNIEVANNWPLVLVPLPREKALQNEFIAPVSDKNYPNPTILNNVPEIESSGLRSKGSFIDIYI